MHYEELQIAESSFKTHEQLQIFKQPDSRLFYEQHLLLTVEDIPKNTKEHSTTTLVQEVKYSHSK